MYVCCSKEPKMLRKTVYLLLTSVLLFGCKSGDDTNVEILPVAVELYMAVSFASILRRKLPICFL
jgi:uncharacterized lipoprotein YajG